MLNRTIFISKNKQEIEPFQDNFDHLNTTVIAHSFLQFEPIPFQLKDSYEALFFGSPRAVDFFLSQETIPDGTIIGCIGEITAEVLHKHNLEADFIGKTSGNASLIAEEFKNFIGNKKILFPQSSISNRSISSVFKASQITEVCVYKTVIHSMKIAACDVYVFTSPSNVDGFLAENKISVNGKIIAWGKTTEKYLKSKELTVHTTLLKSTIAELIKVLEKSKI